MQMSLGVCGDKQLGPKGQLLSPMPQGHTSLAKSPRTSRAALAPLSPTMSPTFPGILVTCLLLSGLAQGQEEAPAPPHARSSCPQGSAFHGSYCYGILFTNDTWDAAELLCQDYFSGHLLSLLNKAEASFVATMVTESRPGQKPFWIGLRDYSENGRWKWSSNTLLIYQAWDTDAPKNDQPNFCAVLTPESGFQKWRNESCDKKYNFLCKFKA
ncbi:lithostathine-1-beta-like [Antechinus flavipes]|uniref:lithostathine-1-beta-like n=1 Tax=Antechinus flavipes TaxID=38775 RepID=UPI002235F8EA|nr:lithostathine-1-beta-like [Antechinus flavipes]